MKIAHIRFSNILGIEELEFTPGGFNEIAGPNGKGKTSILEGIKAAIGGGHDGTLLRKGADKGEIVLILDDGTSIRRKVAADSSSTTVSRNGKPVPRPAEAIKALTDQLSVNPVDFLRAPKKDRVRVLLESMPLHADEAKLSEIAGQPIKLPADLHALPAIDLVHKQIYDARTGTNRAKREKDATVNQLRAAMPEVPPIASDPVKLTAQIQETDAARDAELERIATKLAGYSAEHQKRLNELRDVYDQAVAEENAAFAEIERKAGAQRERKTAEFGARRADLQAQLATANAAVGAVAKRQQTLETIRKMEDEAAALEGEAQAQSSALEALDQYKQDLLRALPISGLEIVDGELLRNGVAFDRLNTGQQVEIAVEIAKLRAKGLAICCVDGLEALDPAHYEAFQKSAAAAGLQLFVTRVTDGDELSINAATP